MPKDRSLDPSSDLRWRLTKHQRFFSEFQKRFDPPPYMMAKTWQRIVNIESIKYFKDRVLDDFKAYGAQRILKAGFRGRDKIIDTLHLLDESMA